MTPEQEQWLIQAVKTNTQMIQELREGQAMLMAFFRQQEGRRELERITYEQDMRDMKREIADLRQDFLNHMRAYHPPQ